MRFIQKMVRNFNEKSREAREKQEAFNAALEAAVEKYGLSEVSRKGLKNLGK